MEREKLKSRLGFILLSAGCAIGIGNVWKFPYIAGQGGGGAFVLFYLIFLIILGLPIMTMEFAVGRASRKSPVRAYQALEKPGQKWHIHGFTAPGPFGNINVQFSQKQIISGETALSLQYPDAHLVLIVSDSVQPLRMTGGDHSVALNDGTETAVFKFAFLVFHHDFRSQCKGA